MLFGSIFGLIVRRVAAEQYTCFLFFCSRSVLALPGRALRRSILQSRTQVRSCRLSLAKPARLCENAPDSGLLAVVPFVVPPARQAR